MIGQLPIGSELAGYRVEAVLGRGGMGVVHRAHDLALDRPVALKVLAPELAADVGFRERFLRESRLAASIDHPNVIPVYDAGEIGGELFIAMRYVEGSDLKRILADGPLSKERTVGIVAQTAAALDAAHARGLVHRDVKPSNVLVGEGDHVYLADFGLTRQLGEPAAALGAAHSLGTADYISPEQIRGDEVDGRADLYSLGCVLQECLTGEPPFRRQSELATLFAHLEEEPSAAPGLEPVMRKVLKREPDDRYQSGRELIEAARSALGLEPKRTRWPLAVAAAGIALIAAALTAFFLVRGGGGVPAEAGADSVVRIDPSTDKVTKETPVGRNASGVAVDGPYVWVSNLADGTVSRIDWQTGNVQTIDVSGAPSGIVAADGLVAIADAAAHKVTTLDAATGTVGLSGTLAGPNVQSLVIGAGPNRIWFGDPGARIVSAVDANLGIGATPEQVSIPPDRTSFVSSFAAFDGLAVGNGDIWVAGDAFGRSVWRVDPTSRRVVHTIRLPFVPGGIAAGEGAVWVTSLLGDTVSRIDPATNRITATIPVGRGVSGIAVGDGAVWVASAFDETVSLINPRARKVTATIPLDGVPKQIAAGPGGVWVTIAPSPGPPPANAIRIGLLADCRGIYAYSYNDTLAPAELPLIERGGRRVGAITDGVDGVSIGGRPVKLFFGCADGTTASGLREARRLVEQEHVDILIGPVTGDEGLALQEYARRHPRVAFVNGASSAQQLHPAPNFFSFWYDGAQWMAGLGTYAYKTLGWRNAVTITGADTFDWAQTAGFDAEFCSLGGKIVKRIWFPYRSEDFSSLVPQLPRSGVDGFLLETQGSGATEALASGYFKGSLARKIVQGTTDFGTPKLNHRTAGVLGSGSPNPPRGYLAALKAAFPEIRNDYLGGAFDYGYYDAMAATLQALGRVHGDLSGGERRFMAALSRVVLDAPNGRTSLSADHQAVAPSVLIENLANGSTRVVKTVPRVDHTFGGYFMPTDPPPSESTPACVKRTPPPWAR
jgi:serine/threonine-protein kinase